MADRLSPATGFARPAPKDPGCTGGGPWPVFALAAIVAATAGWWALALWPAGSGAPEWLARTRAVCFGAAPGSLPDATGWAVLVGQPIGMMAVLLTGWGRETAAGLRAAWRAPLGRVALLAVGVSVLAGLGATATRVVAATATPEVRAVTLRRDEPAPPLVLTAQTGERLDVRRLSGRPVLVVFAYAHCATVCPGLVREAASARRELARRGVPAGLVVVTLDPWRDTPARLPSIAGRWGLAGEDAWVVSGAVEDVEAALDAWGVPRQRDARTGELVHPRLVFVVDAEGRLAWVTSGGAEELVRLGALAADGGGAGS